MKTNFSTCFFFVLCIFCFVFDFSEFNSINWEREEESHRNKINYTEKLYDPLSANSELKLISFQLKLPVQKQRGIFSRVSLESKLEFLSATSFFRVGNFVIFTNSLVSCSKLQSDFSHVINFQFLQAPGDLLVLGRIQVAFH